MTGESLGGNFEGGSPIFPVEKASVFMSRYPAVKCPTCRRQGPWLRELYGPFCSARCKRIDLGKWLNEEMRIQESLFPEGAAEYSGDWTIDDDRKQSE